jgi:hypothetical protein
MEKYEKTACYQEFCEEKKRFLGVNARFLAKMEGRR